MAGAVTGLLLLRRWRRRARTIDLAGARVLIGGGSRGLGLVLARELGARGARVALCARDAGELTRAREDLLARGITAHTLTCDLTDRQAVGDMVDRVVAQLRGLDVLVNNAGLIQVGPLDALTVEDFETAMATNFWSAVYTTLAAVPVMRRRGGGRIVNITSIGGRVSVPHLLPYSASKFAFVGLSLGLRAELRREGILVTTVVPGLMRTGSPRNATFKGQHRAEHAWFAISDSLPGLSMSAERAARAIVAALRHGAPYVVLSAPAKAAALAGALTPGVTAELLAVVNRLLPGPGGRGTCPARGAESESALAPSWLTALSDAAARRNNQVEPAREASRA